MICDKNEHCGPWLRGTWTADCQPQEFFYHEKENTSHCGKCTPVCCGEGPCCGEGFCCGKSPCCGKDPCCEEKYICCCKPEEVHTPCEHHEQEKCCCVQTSSSTGGAGPLGALITGLTAPINVVSTTVNTCCIGKTDNLVQFTGLINLPVALTTTLVFQVYRSSCVGNAIPIGSSYTFAVAVAVLTSQSFSFAFEDSDVAPGVYTYSVQLATGSTTTVAGLSITNATLSVTAVGDD